ncbi:MAG: hypothetical protein WDN27_03350 [Candidatus Saccharibacteria bacterium]
MASFAFINARAPERAYAATASTVNFQARLQTNGGAIVPDGSYNVQFKLYNDKSTGSALWTESYLNTAGQGLTTVNGYLTANLGSITAFSGINWDQPLWLTMNIGGTSSSGPVTWDGEMNPRLPLTAVPYAFAAGQLATTGTSDRSTLSIQAPTGTGDQNFVIQDQGGRRHLRPADPEPIRQPLHPAARRLTVAAVGEYRHRWDGDGRDGAAIAAAQ